jgi:hypothetical protein
MAHRSLSVDELGERCADETLKFTRGQPNDPRYCFELLRLALAEEKPEAFAWVYRVYEDRTLRWVRQHAAFPQTGENAEYFANMALSQLYFALHGPKFEHFPSVARILAYLKVCVHTAIMQHVRRQRSLQLLPLAAAVQAPAQPNFDMQLRVEQLWGRVCYLLPDEKDQGLARCAFVQALKPREIVAAYPDVWRDEREVTVALYRIRQRLRGDDTLRRWLMADTSGPA